MSNFLVRRHCGFGLKASSVWVLLVLTCCGCFKVQQEEPSLDRFQRAFAEEPPIEGRLLDHAMVGVEFSVFASDDVTSYVVEACQPAHGRCLSTLPINLGPIGKGGHKTFILKFSDKSAIVPGSKVLLVRRTSWRSGVAVRNSQEWVTITEP